MNNLYQKIGVCASGFVNDIESAFNELNTNVESLIFRIIESMAIDYIKEVNNFRRAERNLDPIDPGMETHAKSQLMNYTSKKQPELKILINQERMAEKSLFNREEENTFVEKCLAPGVLLNAMIEFWIANYHSILVNIQVKEKKEESFIEQDARQKNNKKIADQLMDSLNSLGKVVEDISCYLNLDEDGIYYPKPNDELSQALRKGIYKRIIKSGIIPDVILPRILAPVENESFSCDVITTDVPYISDLAHLFKSALSESKSTYSYVFLHGNRQYDYFILEEIPAPEKMKVLFPKGIDFGYGFLQKDEKISLYFLQKEPSVIKEIKNVHQGILKKILASDKEKRSSIKADLDEIAIEKIHRLNPLEHKNRILYFVQKSPFVVFPILCFRLCDRYLGRNS